MVGQFDQLVCGYHAFAGIATEVEIIGDAVAGMKIGDTGTYRQHVASGFIARDERQPRRLVETGAVIHVDEIQADGVLADANLARSGGGDLDVLIYQGFRTPYLVHAHGLGHGDFSLGICFKRSS